MSFSDSHFAIQGRLQGAPAPSSKNYPLVAPNEVYDIACSLFIACFSISVDEYYTNANALFLCL